MVVAGARNHFQASNHPRPPYPDTHTSTASLLFGPRPQPEEHLGMPVRDCVCTPSMVSPGARGSLADRPPVHHELGVRDQLSGCALGHAFIDPQRTQVCACASVLDGGRDEL